MTQLIASYELAIGCESTASHPLMLLPPTGGFFLPGETMSDIIQLVPNKWVTEELLTATTGMSKHMIQHARRSTWMEGKHYRHVAPDMAPKQNSPIMYNRDEINHWIEHQSPAKRRRISA